MRKRTVKSVFICVALKPFVNTVEYGTQGVSFFMPFYRAGRRKVLPVRCFYTETLKLLSKLFDVSINTLLGSPRKLICQCCGMPLDDSTISKEPDGTFNEDYCKWCYTEGDFAYKDIDVLINFLTEHMSNEHFPKEQARAYFEEQIPKLKHWSAEE